MGYRLPTSTSWVTASWRDHLDRDPPSSEPGTDYGAAFGSPVYAVGAGVVTYVKTSNSQATGRVVEYRLDDGRTTRSLHMSQTWMYVGQRVSRGQQLGLSGASGFGSDWGYSPHLHQTLWPGEAWANPTIDFAQCVGDTEPEPEPEPPEEDDMPKNYAIYYDNTDAGANSVTYQVGNTGLGWYHEFSNGAGAGPMARDYTDGILTAFDVPNWAKVTLGHAKAVESTLDAVKPTRSMAVDLTDVPTIPPPAQHDANPLVTPAWIVGFFLGLIGFVEVVRFVVDVLV